VDRPPNSSDRDVRYSDHFPQWAWQMTRASPSARPLLATIVIDPANPVAVSAIIAAATMVEPSQLGGLSDKEKVTGKKASAKELHEIHKKKHIHEANKTMLIGKANERLVNAPPEQKPYEECENR
jgi:hypothetical protein